MSHSKPDSPADEPGELRRDGRAAVVPEGGAFEFRPGNPFFGHSPDPVVIYCASCDAKAAVYVDGDALCSSCAAERLSLVGLRSTEVS